MRDCKSNKDKMCSNIKPEQWFNHFKDLLNNDANLANDFSVHVNDENNMHSITCDTCDTNEPDILNHDISEDEIRMVIKNLPTGKSPGIDGIVYELYVHSIDILIEPICKLFNVILNSGVYPDTWSHAIISPLFKKGSRSDVKNYRGISLLCCLGKNFTKILNNRLCMWSEIHGKLDEGQAAYRVGRSTTDHIFTLYALIQKYLSKRKGRFYCTFVAFSRAFDSIPHAHLWYKLVENGIHGKLLYVLQSMYSQLKSCIKTPQGLSEYFQCVIGTRQGCMISPFLFILYINELVNSCNIAGCNGLFVNEMYPNVHMLMYADDIAIFNDSIGRLQRQLNVLGDFCGKYMLHVNLSKTNVIVFRNGGIIRGNEKLYFNGIQVEPCTYYKYLGIMFSSSLKWSIPLQTIAQQSNKAILVVRNIQRLCGSVPVDVCFKLFDKIIAPILLYGSEIWGYEFRKDIEAVHVKFCKYVLGVARNTPNCAALGECGRLPLSVLYMTRCIKYWIRIIQLYNHARYPKCCYILYQLDIAGRHTCATDVKNMLYRFGFGTVWLSQGAGNVELFLCMFKQRVSDISRQEWSSNITSLSKLDTYCTFKSLLEPERYLYCTNIYVHRKALAKLRCSNHNLAIEKLRGTIDRGNRHCKYCLNLKNTYVVEDEYHFIMSCPLRVSGNILYPGIAPTYHIHLLGA